MAERGDHLCLLGRNAHDLERSAADLENRSRNGHSVASSHCDLEEPEGFAPALAQAEALLGGLDVVVVTAGIFGQQEELAEEPEAALKLLRVNFAHTVAFCEEARRRLMALGGGTLCVFSSVAGDRGRKPVVLYGASKAGLSAYLEGLDHRYRNQGLKAICVKPGFVRTGMTSGLTPPPFAGEPGAVARRVLRAIDRGTPVVYAPWQWRWLMLIIRQIPRSLMRRLGF
jgi:short-subunit dehydrogenase